MTMEVQLVGVVPYLVKPLQQRYEEALARGDAYTVTGQYNSGAAETVLAMRNDTMDMKAVIYRATCTNDAITRIRAHSPAAYTNAGTALTPVNLNGKYVTRVANGITHTQNETGNAIAAGSTLCDVRIGADGTTDFGGMLNGLELQYGQALAFDDATGATALGGATVSYFLEPKD